MTSGAQHLADAVQRRRVLLGLSQTDLQSRGGPGVVTVGKIERAAVEQPLPTTLRGLDQALGWKPGSAARVLLGQEPEEAADTGERISAVRAALETDSGLSTEARDVLLRTYALLRESAAPVPDVRGKTAEEVRDLADGLLPEKPPARRNGDSK